MIEPIRILILEDNPADYELVEHAIRKAGLDVAVRRAENREQFVQSLDEFDPHLVISDFHLPSFDAFSALQIVRATRPMLPFILCTGTLGDEVAVEIIKGGATDYVLKTRLARLAPAVNRAMQEVEDRLERERVQNELDKSERRYSLLFANMPLGMAHQEIVIDEHGQPCDFIFRDVNDVFEELVGLKRADILGCRATDVVPAFKTTRRELIAEFGRVALNNEVLRFEEYFENMRRWYNMTVYSTQKGFFITLIQDITAQRRAEDELRRSEQQLLQAQKMEAMGRLAGGVAHDFNNILTVISGRADVLLAKPELGHLVHDNVAEIQDAAARAAALTRQLLAFSRKQVAHPTKIDLNAIITNLLKMLKRLVSEDVRLETQLLPNLGATKADVGQVEQVIMNLVVNARDAMPNGGTLTIKTYELELHEGEGANPADAQPGSYIALAVSDTGCGIGDQDLPHIFEPFFTTKGPEKGTGLGLSTVLGMVREAKGCARVHSQVGIGTTFEILLPHTGAAIQDGPHENASAKTEAGHETILVVEDEDTVRNIVRIILSQQGYRVFDVSSSTEALTLAAEHHGAIHLLLTDVVMPDMNGRKLVDQFERLYPQTRILFMSGYPDDTALVERIVASEASFIQKPFAIEDLLEKVREVLDAPERALDA